MFPCLYAQDTMTSGAGVGVPGIDQGHRAVPVRPAAGP